jgi:hypothetical protein
MTMWKEASADVFLLIDGGEREREWSRFHMSTTVCQWLIGPTEPQRGVGPPCSMPLTGGGAQSGFQRVARARSCMGRTIHNPAC